MRILIISDSHGYMDTAKHVINMLKNDVDYAIHLGDRESDMADIMEGVNIPYVAVSGNCDFIGGSPKSRLITLCGVRLFLCHGHQYDVKLSLTRLYHKGLSENAHAVLFGHTHYPVNVVEGDILFLNPGSIEQPRGVEFPSYGIISICDGAVSGSIVAVMDNGVLKPFDRFNRG